MKKLALEFTPTGSPEGDCEMLCELLWEIITHVPAGIAGPALQITLTRMIASLVDPAADDTKYQAIHDDLSKVIEKHGATYDPRH